MFQFQLSYTYKIYLKKKTYIKNEYKKKTLIDRAKLDGNS